mmetsp:Transcript_17257/g.45614  ORF Transcript_17257/g.45614 Transcript_17257/m.45614 type:complete len:377 (+) Transcript_17257:462-1592(+)
MLLGTMTNTSYPAIPYAVHTVACHSTCGKKRTKIESRTENGREGGGKESKRDCGSGDTHAENGAHRDPNRHVLDRFGSPHLGDDGKGRREHGNVGEHAEEAEHAALLCDGRVCVRPRRKVELGRDGGAQDDQDRKDGGHAAQLRQHVFSARARVAHERANVHELEQHADGVGHEHVRVARRDRGERVDAPQPRVGAGEQERQRREGLDVAALVDGADDGERREIQHDRGANADLAQNVLELLVDHLRTRRVDDDDDGTGGQSRWRRVTRRRRVARRRRRRRRLRDLHGAHHVAADARHALRPHVLLWLHLACAPRLDRAQPHAAAARQRDAIASAHQSCPPARALLLAIRHCAPLAPLSRQARWTCAAAARSTGCL